MPIFFTIHEAPKQVPIDDNENYTLDDNEEASPSSSSENPDKDETEDNYELPDENPEEDSVSEEDTDKTTEEDDDYTLDDSDLKSDEENTDETEEEDTTTDEENTSEDSIEEDDELSKLEDEIFSTISGDQRSIMDRELIRLYVEMYNSISKTLNKIQFIPKNNENLKVLDFSYNKLVEIQEILYDYIISSYKTKTYVENLSNYYEFIASIDGINKIISQLKQKSDEKM